MPFRNLIFKLNILSTLKKTQRKIFIAKNLSSLSSKRTIDDSLVNVVIEPQTKIATLTLNRLPANALNLELLTKIKDAIEELERQKINGIIITSASDRIFSAGLDLNEVYKPNMDRLAMVWKSLQNMWKSIFATPIPTTALINGHALAGGCVIAIACDYRVILPKLTIGLNETRAGIAAPKFVIDNYINVMNSRRVAEADVIEGKCYKSDDALKVGLVDAVADTKEAGFELCKKFLSSYEEHSRLAMAQTKLSFRADILKDFEANIDRSSDLFLTNVSRTEFQEFIGSYLKELKEKSVKKKVL